MRVLREGGVWRFWKFQQVANVGLGFAYHYRRIRDLIRAHPITDREVAATRTLPATAEPAKTLSAGANRLQVVS